MRHKLFSLVPTIFLIILIFVISSRVDPASLEKLARQAGILGPILIIFFGVISNVVAPLSGTPALLAGFFLYGHNTVFLASIATLISNAINFLIARRLGREWVEKFVGTKDMQKVDKFTKEHGERSLFLMRLFLGAFHDFISYAMGLTNMPFRRYYLISLVAAIPGTIIWYLIMLQAQSIVTFTILTYTVSGVFITGFLLVKKLGAAK